MTHAGLPPAVAARIKQSSGEAAKASPDKLDKVRAKAAELRDLDLEIENVEARLKELGKRRVKITQKELVDIFDEVGTDSFSLVPEGNNPAYELKLKPWVTAKIDDENRKKAHSWLTRSRHGDLIKAQVIVNFPSGDIRKARALAKQYKEFSEIREGVHAGTLTAFVKEQIEARRTTPPIDLFGIKTGRVVVIKERKEKRS